MKCADQLRVQWIRDVVKHDAVLFGMELVDGDEQGHGKGGGGECAEDVGKEIVFHDGSN